MIGSWRPPTPFFTSSKPESLGVKGVTGFVGILMAVGILMLGLSIIRFVMQLPPRRVFGKLRFLKGWLFFMWTATHGQILTLDNLMLRGRPLANRCYLCCCNAESVDHLLLFCPITHSLWMYMLRLFGIDWVMPGLVEELLFCWFHWLGKHSSDIWDLVPGCLMWTIWSERNQLAFEDEEKTMVQLLEFCQRTLFNWSCCWGFSNCSTLMDFISSIRID